MRINDVANCLKRNEGPRVQILAEGETLFPSETEEPGSEQREIQEDGADI